MVARSSALFQLTPQHPDHRRRDRRVHRHLRRHHRAGAERYQARAGLFHRQPARLHVPGPGRGCLLGGIFHLFTHAFFKALLFLGSGSVIHAMSGEQDMRRMGGLKNKIPITHWTMWIGSRGHRRHPRSRRLLLQGRDPVAGHSSPAGSQAALARGPDHRRHDRLLHVAPDEHDLLRQVARRPGCRSPYPRIAAQHDRSPDAALPSEASLPAGSEFPKCSACRSASAAFEHWLEPAFASAAIEAAKGGAHDASIEWILMGLSVAVAVIGIVIARYFYHHKPEIPDSIESR